MSATTRLRAENLRVGDRILYNGKRHLIESVKPGPDADSTIIVTTWSTIYFADGATVDLIE